MVSILYLPTRYFPAISGAEFYFQRLAEILQEKFNYNVYIWTSNAIDFSALRSSSGRILEEKNKYYSKVNKVKINRFPIDYEFTLEEKLELIKSVEEYKNLKISDNCLIKLLDNGPFITNFLNLSRNDLNKFDLIHTTYYPYFNLLNALIFGEKLQIPTICTPFFHFENPRYLDKDLMEIIPKFDKLIACTNTEKNFLLHNSKIDERIINVIPMGVDYDKFNKFDKNVSFKKKFFKKAEQNYKMILFCGYKNYEKGAISILKSIPYILEEFNKLYFVFIGPSTQAFNRELSKIKKLKEARIINLTPDNLSGYFDKYKISAFRETEIYLMPSRSDAFGIAYLEAWASSKPVIGADLAATSEVIKNKSDGLLVKFDDPIDIKEKVLQLLNNKKLRKKLGKAGQRKVRENLNWTIIAEKTHQLYQKLINSQKV